MLLQLLVGLSELNIERLPLPVGRGAGEKDLLGLLSALLPSHGTPINSCWKSEYFKDRMSAL